MNTEEKKTYRYESIADNVTRLIEGGTYRPGDRLPSVRNMSRQMGVSITTVMEAYRLLEIRDVVEGRPQSGFYVLYPPLRRTKVSERKSSVLHSGNDGSGRHISDDVSWKAGDINPTPVSMDSIVSMILKHAMDPGLVQLGTNIPDIEMLPVKKLNRALASAVRMRGGQSVSYTFPGIEALRVQIAKRMVAAGCSLFPENILITSGCQEAVFLSLATVCSAGDTVVIESPVYFNHLQAIEKLGLKVLEIPSHPQKGMSLDTLRYVLENTAVKACLVVSSFSNPLGSCMSDEDKKDLASILAGYDIPLIEDDIYGDICFSSHRPKTVKAFDRTGNVILCSSFSKTLAPGFRVGWTVPGRYMQQIQYQKLVYNLATATPPQMAVAEFLANGGYEHFLRRVRRSYARNVFTMRRAILEHFPEGTEVSKPTGGFFLWVELPQGTDSITLYEKAIKAGITLAPGPIFSARQKFRNCLRLNAAVWSEQVEKAVAEIGRLAKQMVS